MVRRARFAGRGRPCAALACGALAIVLLASCEPELRDGIYGCASGQCPDGWFCHTNMRCYREPEAEPEIGVFNAELLGASCDDDTQCEPGLCAAGPDEASSDGYCSAACDTDADCPMIGGKVGLCLGAECVAECQGAGDCKPPFGCYEAATGMTSGVLACFTVPDTALHGGTVCTGGAGGGTCPEPAFCVASPMIAHVGVCSLRCGQGTECPGDGVCVNVAGSIEHCMLPCRTDDDCDGLTCADFGENHVCIPVEWVGQMPPLPGGTAGPGGGAQPPMP